MSLVIEVTSTEVAGHFKLVGITVQSLTTACLEHSTALRVNHFGHKLPVLNGNSRTNAFVEHQYFRAAALELYRCRILWSA